MQFGNYKDAWLFKGVVFQWNTYYLGYDVT
jgi:hypothetical protein